MSDFANALKTIRWCNHTLFHLLLKNMTYILTGNVLCEIHHVRYKRFSHKVHVRNFYESYFISSPLIFPRITCEYFNAHSRTLMYEHTMCTYNTHIEKYTFLYYKLMKNITKDKGCFIHRSIIIPLTPITPRSDNIVHAESKRKTYLHFPDKVTRD